MLASLFLQHAPLSLHEALHSFIAPGLTVSVEEQPITANRQHAASVFASSFMDLIPPNGKLGIGKMSDG
jgi:hypothetical protein